MGSITDHRFVRFCIVGGTGFVVDLTVLLGMIQFFDANPVKARIFSFAIALSVTWILNRTFTFHAQTSDNRLAEWIRYAFINSTGGAINLAIYSALIMTGRIPFSIPFVALSIASAIALIFNYFGSKIFVFIKKPNRYHH